MLFTPEYVAKLEALLNIDTVTPMETGEPSSIAQANACFSQWAQQIGMREVFNGAGALPAAEQVPVPVQRRMAGMPGFLESQPHLVLEVGEGVAPHTVMFNFHMDTVSPHLPVRVDGTCVHGRGAVDNKGPGLALLAALEGLRTRHPQVLEQVRVLIQVVAGEEGGAMGVYGTRHLCALGYQGRLNVFVEPTGGGYFDASTTSMTYEVSMDGEDSTDDFPQQGDNATLVLGFVAQSMAARLAAPLQQLQVKMTLAGLHTGMHHNRVYGSGRCLFNFAYRSAVLARDAEGLVDEAFKHALQECQARFAGCQPFARTVERLQATCQARWLKRGLPVLDNHDAALQCLLAEAGIVPNPDPAQAFTCDAMWAQGQDAYSVVWGPGSLAANGAHTSREHVSVTELEHFAQAVQTLLITVARQATSTAKQG
ncbi:TPA: M20/M25/M40 family metallo-hydrolase [Pseudomonas putida]|uniref:M20/M25/M40 family metallo-hydrolase n=1 Tax=Pseudomonas TaxID=286 RepID=UPI0018655D47|nr:MULTISPECIES: M20/M25/M40 family metallo-hydrolase [Pseudomonas]MDD1995067.1 M20/M25/M40 family metallo-hydrolase [Pseudomonas putida]HDS0919416.1 M20/M25/M40 family metallo-hydrolase [Pseudomonas putida]HDS0933804.1 M20/M25/M40 family metallo-hydrolase [Pseudomonas putida]HDS1783916.1 M20/M25/M40 family metallo-hydrolase [Pseudomonas putida]HDS3799718.1 M20/M25/M40 family metallo-hydrolase [Pseudomonas putida]